MHANANVVPVISGGKTDETDKDERLDWPLAPTKDWNYPEFTRSFNINIMLHFIDTRSHAI